jgi:hypothetical protein
MVSHGGALLLRDDCLSGKSASIRLRSRGLRVEKSVARKLRFAQTFQNDLGRPVPSRKNNSLSIPSKSMATSALSRPDKRADRESSRNAGRDVVDASASARKAIAGRGQTRERFAARETNGVSRVRQNRVVLTPVAGAKSAEAHVGPTGLRRAINPLTTVTRRIRSPGRARHKP